MQTVPYNEIEHASESDIGQVCLMWVGGPVLAIESTLTECLRAAQRVDDTADIAGSVNTTTDIDNLTTDDLVAVEIGAAE